jgi:DNA replication protein DnaC
MDELAMLKPKLTRLKLSGVLETLADRMQRAMGEKWSYSQFLDVLVSDEVERRDHKQLARRLSKSGLDAQKTLESFPCSCIKHAFDDDINKKVAS